MRRLNHQCLPQVFGCCCPLASITLLILFLPLQTTMGDFVLLSADVSLWEPVTKVRWGSHDFCLVVKSFHVWVIMQAQLNTLSWVGVGGCGEALAEHGIHLNSAKHCYWAWKGLWPCGSMDTSPPSLLPHSRGGGPQTCTAGGQSVDWAYTFVWLNETLSHAPLSSDGHVSTMTDCAPSTAAHDWLCHLQICKYCSTRTWWYAQKVWMAS